MKFLTRKGNLKKNWRHFPNIKDIYPPRRVHRAKLAPHLHVAFLQKGGVPGQRPKPNVYIFQSWTKMNCLAPAQWVGLFGLFGLTPNQCFHYQRTFSRASFTVIISILWRKQISTSGGLWIKEKKYGCHIKRKKKTDQLKMESSGFGSHHNHNHAHRGVRRGAVPTPAHPLRGMKASKGRTIP